MTGSQRRAKRRENRIAQEARDASAIAERARRKANEKYREPGGVRITIVCLVAFALFWSGWLLFMARL